VIAIPLGIFGLVRTARGSVRGLVLWLGTVAYAVYNYAFYLFGAAINAFFLLYVLAFVLATVSLILGLSQRGLADIVAGSFQPRTPIRIVGGSLVFLGVGLASVWIGMWAAHVFAGRPTPVEPQAFRLVAALDLSLMVPALTAGGVLLWRRTPWGHLIASIAAIQAGLYLLVLSVNSIVAIQLGFATAPGELPIWGVLAVFTTTLASVLLTHVQQEREVL
jgi:hypothetical protein